MGILHEPGRFSPKSKREIQERLGLPNVFDVVNLHNQEAAFLPLNASSNNFEFDLARRDERICVAALLKMALIEGGENLLKCHWSGQSEHCDTNFWTIPAAWFRDGPAEHGMLEFAYHCRDVEAAMEKRRLTGQDFLGWVTLNIGS